MAVKQGSRVAAAAGAVVLAGMLGACTSGGGASGTAAPAGPTDLTKARAVLTQSRSELKQLVDSLAASANPASRGPFPACTETAAGASPDSCSGFDAEAPCVAGNKDWPQRWGYNLNLHLTSGDAMDSGQAVVRQLAGSKWQLQEKKTSSGVLDVTGQKNGMSVRVTVDDLPGVVNLEGYGPCISAAGTSVTA